MFEEKGDWVDVFDKKGNFIVRGFISDVRVHGAKRSVVVSYKVTQIKSMHLNAAYWDIRKVR